MPIPPFDATGALPVGEHQATFDEVASRYRGNAVRERLVEGLREMLRALARAGCRRVWLDGSFVTEKPAPGDFDLAWDEEGVDDELLDPIFDDFADGRAAQKQRFLGEAFPASGPADALGTPFREFFQQAYGTPKGIIVIALDQMGGAT